jgi:hypothetical protein
MISSASKGRDFGDLRIAAMTHIGDKQPYRNPATNDWFRATRTLPLAAAIRQFMTLFGHSR